MLYVAACTCRLATRQASEVLLGIACCILERTIKHFFIPSVEEYNYLVDLYL